ncbi:MAG TPA: hypothetical protein VIW73_05955 [Candidatus Cybelea sp.]
MSAQPLEVRMAHIEGAFLQLDRRMESVERRLDALFNQLEGRFSIVDQRFNWLTGILVTSWISTIVTVLLHR